MRGLGSLAIDDIDGANPKLEKLLYELENLSMDMMSNSDDVDVIDMANPPPTEDYNNHLYKPHGSSSTGMEIQ